MLFFFLPTLPNLSLFLLYVLIHELHEGLVFLPGSVFDSGERHYIKSVIKCV